MRTLLILRGAPGCGKSTFVEKNGLLPYTLCPDTLRVMCSSRELQADGRFAVARNNNTEKYQKIVSLLSDKLLADDNGQKRVFVPDVSFVKNGKILFHDNETSVIDSNISPDEYWNDNNIRVFKAKMTSYISDYTGTCSTCN